MVSLGLLLELLLESRKAAELACLCTIPRLATVQLAPIRRQEVTLLHVIAYAS